MPITVPSTLMQLISVALHALYLSCGYQFLQTSNHLLRAGGESNMPWKLANPSWMVACPAYTLQMMMLLPGWPTQADHKCNAAVTNTNAKCSIKSSSRFMPLFMQCVGISIWNFSDLFDASLFIYVLSRIWLSSSNNSQVIIWARPLHLVISHIHRYYYVKIPAVCTDDVTNNIFFYKVILNYFLIIQWQAARKLRLYRFVS